MTKPQYDIPDLSLRCATLVELLRARATHQSQQLAFTFLQDGEVEAERWTYQDLDQRSRAIAAQLQALGFQGERALLLYPPGLEYLAAFFGCLYAGVVAVPAYPPRNHRNTPRIQAVVADAEAAIALTTTTIFERTKSLLSAKTGLENLRWLTTDDITVDSATDWVEPALEGNTLAFLQYTSGSTGTPKGVMVSHGNLLHNAATTYEFMGHNCNSKFVSWLPTYHDMGLIGGILQPLYGGFPCILMAPASFLQRPYRWLKAISDYQATTSGGPNFAYELCVEKITPEQRATLDLSHWRVAFNGAEPIRPQTLEKFATTFAECGFRPEAAYPCYGLAEGTLMVTGSQVDSLPVLKTVQSSLLEQNQVQLLETDSVSESELEDSCTLISSGRCIPNQEIIIVHPEKFTRCQPHEVGEIWVAGPSVGKGYWNRPTETAEVFQAYLADTQAGPFMRTGDLGFLQDGELFVTGRAKDVIILRGRNLYPQDIEQIAERSHPSLRVTGSAAFAVEVDQEERLVVVQEIEFRATPNAKEVIVAIRQAIAEVFELQVYGVVLIKAGTIPKTSSGKIQRRACRQAFLDQTLEVFGSSILSAAEMGTTPEPEIYPLTRSELMALPTDAQKPTLIAYLRSQIARILQLPLTQVEPAAALNALGIDSLSVFELKNRIEADLAVSVAIADLFDGASVAKLAGDVLANLGNSSRSELALRPINQTENLPLSFAQERLWFFHQLQPDSALYNLCATAQLTGRLNVAALKQSLNAISQRHAVLRTRFVMQQEQPIQVISAALDLDLPVIDLSDRTPEEREAEVQRLTTEAAQTPFVLSQDQLIRICLLQLSSTEHVLLLTAHHIIFDGWSVGVFWRDLAVLYQSYVAQAKPSLPALPVQYADFAVWQRQWLQEQVLEPQLAYWQQQLAGTLPLLNLPTDRPRPAVQSFRGRKQRFTLSRSQVAALQALQQSGATVFMSLLAVFKTLLYRYTGQSDLLVGAPIANRNRVEIEDLIGFCVNTLVLRTDVSGELSFLELLQRVRQTILAAYAHQDVPFEKLVEVLQPERDLSYSPLFQVMFDLQPEQTAIALPELEVAVDNNLDTGIANFDLTLSFLNTTEGDLQGTVEYNTDLFDASTIARLIVHFQTLLTSVLTNPQQRLAELTLLTTREKKQVLEEWNQTTTDYPRHLCIHQLFEAQAEKTPEAVAVISGNISLTYRQLNERANQLAHYLQKLGVGAETLVGICVERSPEMLIGLLGILKAGGAYVPLDPNYPVARLAFMVRDTQVSVVLTQSHLKASLPNTSASIICLDSDRHLFASVSSDNLLSVITPENLAYVMYTSGSTGEPKGVSVMHRGVVRLVQGNYYATLNASEVFLQLASIAFDASTFEIWGSLLNGAKLVLAPPGVPSLQELGQTIRNHQITTLWLTAGLFHQMVDNQLEDLTQVKQLLAGGDVLSPNHVRQLLRAAPGIRLIDGYGPTENTTFTCCHTLTNVEQVEASVPIGRPIANTQVYLLDAHLQPVPVGVPGELYIAGDGLARGYFNRPDLTAERFVEFGERERRREESGVRSQERAVASRSSSSDRLYRTGDIARYRSDGTIEFLGRVDNQVKLRGFRVELGEIEAALNLHPAVQTSVAIAQTQASNQFLVAYVLPSAAIAPTVTELRTFLKAKLPEYMIPNHFVFLTALPLTANGKVDRQALPSIEEMELEFSSSYVAPRTLVEQQLAELWAVVLGRQSVGIHDNFFELGGHSLLATQLIAKIRDAFQVELPLRCIFQSPTVAELAEIIAQADVQLTPSDAVVLSEIVPDRAQRYQPFPLNEMQQAYWLGRNSFFEMGNVAIHGYVEIESDQLDVARFSRAWQRLVERHDMLRAIVLPDGQQQILEQVPPYEIPVLDLRGQEPDVVTAQLAAIRDELSHQVLSLDRYPLFDLRASRLSDRHIRLHLSMDAICLDGWSYQILFQDLIQLYCQPDDQLVPLDLSFRDYVLATLELQTSALYQQSLEYWQKRLQTLPPPPELPLAQSPSALTQPRFQRWSAELDAKRWQRLKARAGRSRLSPTGLLLAAYAEVLTTWSKSPRFTLNIPRFNRLPLHPQVNQLLGEFASFTLLEVDASQPASFELRAKRLQTQLLQDLEYPYVSGVRIMRELAQAQGNTTAMMPIVFTTFPQNNPGEANSAIAALLEPLGDVVYLLGQTPQVWIDSQYSEANGNLCLNWDAVADLFPAGLLDDMFAAYYQLLDRLATDATAWETPAQLLPPAQQQQRATINTNAAPIPDKLLQVLFTDQVAQRPQQTAIITPDRTLAYEELNQRVNQVGHRLRRLGAHPNQLVAVVMDKGWEQVVAALGILTAGAAYLPIDPELPSERLGYVLQNAEVEIVLTQSWLCQNLALPASVQAICIDTDELAPEPITPLEAVQQLDDLAYVIYTSGSTGLPKGVMIAHRGVVNAIAQTNQVFKIGDCDRVLAVTALYHDMSVYDLFGTLAAGGTIVMPAASDRRDPAHWLDLIAQHQVTVWNSVPAMMEMLLEYAAGKTKTLPQLRWAFLGGDWISVTLPDRLQTLAEQAQVVSVGGPTETTLWNIWYPVKTVDPHWKSIPYGQPIANTQYYILNEALEECPVWVPGQMYCAGVGLAKGYWRNPEKTAESFIQHPVTGARLYRTGDMGRYLPDGNIEFLGREDFRLKIRGHRIEAGEIEAVLNQHPQVRSSVVMAIGKPSHQTLVAFVTAHDTAATPEALRQFLSQKLPEYMLPTSFVMLEAFPLSTNGKVDRRALTTFALSDWQQSEKAIALPQTALEKVLAGIWAEVLQVEQVGLEDHFFLDWGGNSLSATQVVVAIREALQVELPLRCMFESPTIAAQRDILLQDPSQRSHLNQTAALLLEVAALSDDEVETLLEQKLQVGV